jgi:hypothetical protein
MPCVVRFRCAKGHVESSSITREGVTYRSMAQRITLNCQFLLAYVSLFFSYRVLCLLLSLYHRRVRPATTAATPPSQRPSILSLAVAFAKLLTPHSVAWSGVIDAGLRDAASRASQRALALRVLSTGVKDGSSAVLKMWSLMQFAAALRSWREASSNACVKQRWECALANCGASGYGLYCASVFGSFSVRSLFSVYSLAAVTQSVTTFYSSLVQLVHGCFATSGSNEQKQALLLGTLDCLNCTFDPYVLLFLN